MNKLHTLSLLLAAGSCLYGVPAASAKTKTITYTYTSIVVPNSLETTVAAVNASGTVVGAWYDQTFTGHGYAYSNGTVTDLDFPNGSGTTPYGINSAGEIVGTYFDSNYVQHGFTCKIGASGTPVFTSFDYPTAVSTLLYAIDAKGNLFGTASGGGNAYFLFEYSAKKYTTLVPSGNPTPSALSTTDNIAGGEFPSGGYLSQAFVDVAGAATTIPLPTGAVASWAYGINSTGTAVGYTQSSSYTYSGFIYAAGTATPLNAPGAVSTLLYGISNAGVIVGITYDANYNIASFAYSKGNYSPIAVPGGTNTSVSASTAKGVVVGTYYDANYNQDVFLATPAP